MSDCTLISNMKAVFPKVGSELQLHRHAQFAERWTNAAAIAGTTALAETCFGRVKTKSRLVGLTAVPSAAVTANGTNYFTVVVRKRTAAVPGTQVAIASFPVDTATTDDLAAFTVVDLLTRTGSTVGTATDLDFADGDVITVEITKTGGSGLAFPICTLQALFEPRD